MNSYLTRCRLIFIVTFCFKIGLNLFLNCLALKISRMIMKILFILGMILFTAILWWICCRIWSPDLSLEEQLLLTSLTRSMRFFFSQKADTKSDSRSTAKKCISLNTNIITCWEPTTWASNNLPNLSTPQSPIARPFSSENNNGLISSKNTLSCQMVLKLKFI